ncbi:hypothetical protein H4R35_002364 [Dimargaris xerosporica]|nr:hypothetical protein H4R35_002364 [Dimargaris xerosporica]
MADESAPAGRSRDQMPASFKQFLTANAIPPSLYDDCRELPRYFRLSPRLTEAEAAQICSDIAVTFATSVHPAPGVPGFWYTPKAIKLSACAGYQRGQVYGIDVTSGLAVLALDLEPSDHVLDLCCAPGAKLCMVSDILGDSGSGTVTGVDISTQRLATCRSLLKKYRRFNARLYQADGTTFALRAPRSDWRHPGKAASVVQLPPSPADTVATKPFYAPRLLRFRASSLAQALYDKVLVDAECTHDGSIAHILKYDQWGWDRFERQFLDPARLATITELQRQLMANGWRMLRPGGVLVYSTCSLTRAQNEDVVAWFLDAHPTAALEPVPHCREFLQGMVRADASLPTPPLVRFNPVETQTSGFFIARIRKPPEPEAAG